MTVKEIAKIIEDFAPLDLCFDGDNSGLCIGDVNMQVEAAMIVVDVTVDIMKEAAEKGCNLIISHHPAVFSKTKKFLTGRHNCDIIKFALENNLALYSAHTNLDACKGGINDYLISAFGLKDSGLGQREYWRIGKLENGKRAKDFLTTVQQALCDKHIKTSGNMDKVVDLVAVSCGSGGRDDDLIEYFKDCGVKLFVTAEVKESIVRTLNYYNINLIEVGHYDSEKCFKNIIEELLKDCDLKIEKCNSETNPYN